MKLDSRETPPPLHFSPALSDRDRSSTRETSPIGTPQAFGPGAGLPRKTHQQKEILPWNNRPISFSDNPTSFVDDSLLETDYENSTFTLFDDGIDHNKMGSRATPVDIASSPQAGSRFTSSTNALHPTTGNETRVSGAIDISGGSSKRAMSNVFGRRDSVAQTGAQPMSTNGSSRVRKDSLASSMATGMSWGGISVGSWIRDE